MMKLLLMAAVSVLLTAAAALTQAGTDQEERALARPTPQQAAWQDFELGMFIRFAPNTWQDQEYDDLSTPLDKINPSKPDADQWVRVARKRGAKYIVF